MRDLPAAVRAKAHEAGVDSWAAALPSLVASLAERWSLRLGPAFADATEAYVAPAVRADGSPAVLKVLVPGRGPVAAREIAVLRLAGGVGCAELLAYDMGEGALLLERLGPPMSAVDMPHPRRLEILCDLAAAMWRRPPTDGARPHGPSPSPGPLISGRATDVTPATTRSQPEQASLSRAAATDPPATTRRQPNHPSQPWAAATDPPATTLPLLSGAEKAAHLAGYIRRKWAHLGEPCAERTVAHALAAARNRERAHDPARAVVVHGDVHQWNALRAGDGFKLVDPDGLIAEPEYDLGVLMREDPVELIAGDPWERARWLAGRTGTDPVAVWEWGVVERVATGLTLTGVGVQPVAAAMLAAADTISAM